MAAVALFAVELPPCLPITVRVERGDRTDRKEGIANGVNINLFGRLDAPSTSCST